MLLYSMYNVQYGAVKSKLKVDRWLCTEHRGAVNAQSSMSTWHVLSSITTAK